jgi:hypothetical protein
MNLNLPFSNAFPKSVAWAFYLLVGGWAGHLLFIYLFFSIAQGPIPDKILFQQLAIVGFLGYFLYRAKKWSRPLCLLCNALIIVLYACLAALFFQSRPWLGLLALWVVAVFAAASWLLLGRDAKAHFDGSPQGRP